MCLEKVGLVASDKALIKVNRLWVKTPSNHHQLMNKNISIPIHFTAQCMVQVNQSPSKEKKTLFHHKHFPHLSEDQNSRKSVGEGKKTFSILLALLWLMN